MKLPWVKWFPADWLSDKELAKTSLLGRGLWNEALQVMINDDTYYLRGTCDDLARVLRCPLDELLMALKDLSRHSAADLSMPNVTLGVTVGGNGLVTLISRRLMRNHKKREDIRLRVQKHRSNKSCNSKTASASASASDLCLEEGGMGEGGKFNPELPVSLPNTGCSSIIKLRDDVAKLFHRKQNDRWNYAEESYLCEVARRPDALTEFSTIADYYAKPDSFPRQSIESLLEHWAGELDKARNYKNGSRTNENGPRHNPRNDHIVRGPTNYGEAALRIAARPPKQVD